MIVWAHDELLYFFHESTCFGADTPNVHVKNVLLLGKHRAITTNNIINMSCGKIYGLECVVQDVLYVPRGA